MKNFLSATLLICGTMAASAQNDTISKDTDRKLSTIVVTGTRNNVDFRDLPQTVKTYHNEDLRASYGLSMLPTISELTPGMFTTSRGIIGYGVSTNAAGGIKVRGVGSGAEFLVLIDGQPQYAGLMGHPIPDAYQNLMADKVEIIRGPSSMMYGSNAMGGVMNIVTQKRNHEFRNTAAQIGWGSYGTMQTEICHSRKEGPMAVNIGFNYQNTDGHRENSDFKQYSLFANTSYDIKENWTVSGDINYTMFDFANPGPESAPLLDADADIKRGLASISLSNKYEKSSGTIRAYYDWGHHEINDGHLATAAPRDYLYMHDDHIGGINAYEVVKLYRNNTTTFGFDWQTFGGEAWNDFFNGDKKPYDKIENQNEIAGYVDLRQKITKSLCADFGVRVDKHSQAGTEIVPQGGLTYTIKESHNIKALVSKGFRNPTISEMYMFAANPDLEPERMINYELAYDGRIVPCLDVKLNLYYIKGDNLIERTKNPSGAGFKQMNVGEFENYGVELEAKYRISDNWILDANYSYLHMDKPVVSAPEHKSYLGVNYTKKRVSAGINLQNVSGLYLTTGENAEKEDYTLLNANFGYRFMGFITVFAKGENLLGQKYQTYDGFYMPKATIMAGARFEVFRSWKN